MISKTFTQLTSRLTEVHHGEFISMAFLWFKTEDPFVFVPFSMKYEKDRDMYIDCSKAVGVGRYICRFSVEHTQGEDLFICV